MNIKKIKTVCRLVPAIVLAGIMTVSAVSCGESTAEKAGQLLQQAAGEYDKGAYAQCLTTIDSLRRAYPKEVGVRRQALALWQRANRSMAQQQIEALDGQLQQAQAEWGELSARVAAHRRDGVATADELSALTRLTLRRDSLQARFDAQCAIVKKINAETGR